MKWFGSLLTPTHTDKPPAGGRHRGLAASSRNPSPLSPTPRERDGNQNATHDHTVLAGSEQAGIAVRPSAPLRIHPNLEAADGVVGQLPTAARGT